MLSSLWDALWLAPAVAACAWVHVVILGLVALARRGADVKHEGKIHTASLSRRLLYMLTLADCSR